MGGWCSLSSSSAGSTGAPWSPTPAPWWSPVPVCAGWGWAKPVGSAPPPHLRGSPPSAAWGARGAHVGGEGAVVPGDRPPLLPTATGRPRGGLPDIGRGSEGGTVSVIRGREEGGAGGSGCQGGPPSPVLPLLSSQVTGGGGGLG